MAMNNAIGGRKIEGYGEAHGNEHCHLGQRERGIW
jgi:hypothetical protein